MTYDINDILSSTAQRIEEITEGKLADLVLDFVGAGKVTEQEIHCVGKGGRMVLVV
jgi:threonine dehydrogenase-like Zn-dependent dehydrogenase